MRQKIYDYENNRADFNWFDADEGRVYERVFNYAKFLRQTQSYFYHQLQRLGNIYEERPFFIYGANKYTQTVNNNAVSLNVCASTVDTLQSKITQNIPTVMCVTNDADYVEQQKAQNLTDFWKGEFYRSKFDEKVSELANDAYVYGTGILQAYFDGTGIQWERILPFELMIDLTEGCYREPKQIHKIRFINRHSLAAKFRNENNKYASDDKVRKILQAPVDRNIIFSNTRTTEMVLVVESWYLASEEGGNDGRYCMTIDGCDLVDEEYSHTWFPFLIYRYKKAKMGFFGIGLVEEIKQIQYELNYLIKTMQLSTYLLAVPKIYIQEGSVISSHLNNDVGTICKYKGTPPISAPLGTVPTDLYNQISMYYEKAYEIAGISSLSAQAKKPAGLNSGKAMDTYLDVESDRFATTQRDWENIYKEAAILIVRMGKDIIKENPEYGTMSFGEKVTRRIRFSEVDLDEDAFMIKIRPISSLPDDPAELLSYVQTLMQSQIIDVPTGIELLKLPDVSYSLDLQNAQHHACLKLIGQIIESENDEPIEIDPLIDISMLIKYAQNAVLYYKYKIKAPDEVLNKLLIVVEQCKRALDIMQQQQMQEQMMMQMQVAQAQQSQQVPPPIQQPEQMPIAG